MAKQLKIKLLPTGEIIMETQGIKGKKCLDYIPFMEQISNARAVEQKFTNEYYEAEESETTYNQTHEQNYNTQN